MFDCVAILTSSDPVRFLTYAHRLFEKFEKEKIDVVLVLNGNAWNDAHIENFRRHSCFLIRRAGLGFDWAAYAAAYDFIDRMESYINATVMFINDSMFISPNSLPLVTDLKDAKVGITCLAIKKRHQPHVVSTFFSVHPDVRRKIEFKGFWSSISSKSTKQRVIHYYEKGFSKMIDRLDVTVSDLLQSRMLMNPDRVFQMAEHITRVIRTCTRLKADDLKLMALESDHDHLGLDPFPDAGLSDVRTRKDTLNDDGYGELVCGAIQETTDFLEIYGPFLSVYFDIPLKFRLFQQNWAMWSFMSTVSVLRHSPSWTPQLFEEYRSGLSLTPSPLRFRK